MGWAPLASDGLGELAQALEGAAGDRAGDRQVRDLAVAAGGQALPTFGVGTRPAAGVAGRLDQRPRQLCRAATGEPVIERHQAPVEIVDQPEQRPSGALTGQQPPRDTASPDRRPAPAPAPPAPSADRPAPSLSGSTSATPEPRSRPDPTGPRTDQPGRPTPPGRRDTTPPRERGSPDRTTPPAPPARRYRSQPSPPSRGPSPSWISTPASVTPRGAPHHHIPTASARTD